MPKTVYAVQLRFETDSEKPPNAMRNYIRDALETWSGQLEPPNEDNEFEGDPMWGTHSMTHIRINKLPKGSNWGKKT